ncbi:MAG: HAMP domain-containing sensor histidine kinase [Nitrososphaeraceae archaeon]
MNTTANTRSTERTEVLYGQKYIMNTVLQFLSQAEKIDSCGDHKALSLIFEVEEYKELLSNLKAKGIKLRYITDITKDNIHYCKELLKFAKEIRHLGGIRTNFSISEIEYLSSMTGNQTREPVSHIIYSNVRAMVEEQKYVFESFWNKAIPAEQRIREIEEGIEPEVFEIIAERKKIAQTFLDLLRSTKKEALVLFPNDKAMVRADRLGIIDYLVELSQKEKAVSIKIICQLSKENVDIVNKVSEQAPAIRILNGNDSLYGMYIIDDEKLLRIEMRDASAETFMEAIGFAVYSNRKNTVQSFKSVFELLWNERTLNEELKRADKMQKEFINVASHELRTPTQAILSFSELLQTHPERKDEMLQAMSRNAIRLQKLTDDILDVTRIESETLMLKIEPLDLNDLISNIVEDYRNQIEKNNDNVELLYYYRPRDNDSKIIIEADRVRLIQVISNLLDNALKFTKKQDKESKKGLIYVTAEKKKNRENGSKKHEVVVSIKDTGIGIDPEIVPRLFTKFATTSETGTGLGLFICKSIVAAHGGRIWAENNPDSKGGAVFELSLPLSEQQQQQQQQQQYPSSSNLTSGGRA